ncbi:DNA-binding domain-containing protein [Aliiroseovarius sp.]|uniref:HvfC/BufC N-terminal domain-containing protein n=1 Tax=Aliiroseovarius sp. TaxID=1872442 RepID=UPI00262EA7AA|nr:DNA-binding domain-containing protein [Aliiroseovarius sp.]
MTVTQTDFRAGLMDAARPVPPGLSDAHGAGAGKRFDVYRNNVAVSLTEALEQAFPTIHALVGDEFFKAMAGVYLRQSPPASPILSQYGATFPRFLSGFQPVAHLGYLPDVARLEQAMRESFHAGDAAPADPAALQDLPPDRLMSARLILAPATRLVRSPWPIHSVWMATNRDGPAPTPGAQEVLITRPEFDPLPTLLPAGGADFIEALATHSFGAALATAQRGTPDFDLTTTLGALVAGRAIARITEG